MKTTTSLICALLGALSLPAWAVAAITLSVDPAAGERGKFAAEEIRREAAVPDRGGEATHIVITVATDGQAPAQGYGLRVQNEGGRRVITVRGDDATGAMYGGLDVAEAIRTGTLATLADADRQPHIAQRGIKFNLPLDLRTPSYSDSSDAAQGSGAASQELFENNWFSDPDAFPQVAIWGVLLTLVALAATLLQTVRGAGYALG